MEQVETSRNTQKQLKPSEDRLGTSRTVRHKQKEVETSSKNTKKAETNKSK